MEFLQSLERSFINGSQVENLESRQFGQLGTTNLGGPLSSFYQLNVGLIGIGALAVIAIIASRNFFANYMYEKSLKVDYKDYGYPHYDYGYYRRNWYNSGYGDDEPYDQYYGKYNSRQARSIRTKRSKKHSFQNILTTLEYLNKLQCGYKFICQLSQQKNISLEQRDILDFIRKTNHLKGDYEAALNATTPCNDVYSKCPYDAKKLQVAVNSFLHSTHSIKLTS